MNKRKTRKAGKAKPPPVKPKPDEEKEERFDFGGLPQRDLKKNLGCG